MSSFSFIINPLSVVWICTVRHSGAASFVFQQCHPSRQTDGQPFTISDCPVGQVISIQSAKVGFNTKWNRDGRRPRCSERDVTCTRSTQHPAIMRCNGQRTCSFSHGVLSFPQNNVQRLCSRHNNANFILINYQCVNGNVSCISNVTAILCNIVIILTIYYLCNSSATITSRVPLEHTETHLGGALRHLRSQDLWLIGDSGFLIANVNRFFCLCFSLS